MNIASLLQALIFHIFQYNKEIYLNFRRLSLNFNNVQQVENGNTFEKFFELFHSFQSLQELNLAFSNALLLSNEKELDRFNEIFS